MPRRFDHTAGHTQLSSSSSSHVAASQLATLRDNNWQSRFVVDCRWWNSLNLSHCVHPIDDSTEHNMLTIPVRSRQQKAAVQISSTLCEGCSVLKSAATYSHSVGANVMKN